MRNLSRSGNVLSSEMSNSVTAAQVLEGGAGGISLDGLKLRLAVQVAPRGWRRSLGRLATAVDQGHPLDEAFHAVQLSLPKELRCLMSEALSVGDPVGLLLEALRVRDEVGRNWRELMMLIAYPLCLFGFALSVAVAFSFVMTQTVSFAWIEEFGFAGFEYVQAGLLDQHHAILGLGIVTGWVAVVLLTIFFVGPTWAWVAVVGGIVVFGKPLRWISLQEILYRFNLFVSQGLGTSEAAAAVSRSFGRSSQSVVTQTIASRIAAGVPLGRAMSLSMLSDGLCRPALLMLDLRGQDMSRALLETAELFGVLVEQRCQTLRAILPVFLLCLIGTILWGTLCSYIMGLVPLISLITSLA